MTRSQLELAASFSKAQEHKNERDRVVADQAKAILAVGELPTPDNVIDVIRSRVGNARSELFRQHAYWKEHKLRRGFDALVSAALAAHLDLCRCEAALAAYADNNDSFEGHIDHTVSTPAQKEVMAFCAAYAGTIDTLRRLKVARPELAESIDELRLHATGSAEFTFLLDLRKNLSHGSVTVPDWSVQSDFTTTSGTMRFSGQELLAFGD
jgi:AraC-like DNA-binding protein